MQRHRNEFFLFLLSVLVMGILIGNGLSSYVTAQTGSAYTDLELFSDALAIVQNEYVDDITTRDLVYNALKGMLNGLDAHSQFMPPDTYKELKVETEGHFGGLGIVVSLDENKVLTVVSPIEDTPAYRAGVQANDKIIKIDGESTQGLVLEEAVKKLRGPKGTKVTITVLRLHENDGQMPEELEFTLTRDDIKIRSVTWDMMAEGIGRVRIREFSEQTAAELRKALDELKKQEMRSLILDLRNNPGGLLNVAADVADEFLEKGKLIVYTESRHADQNMKFKAKHDPSLDSNIPMVVLVNGGSASASEIVAGALKDWHRAVILGEKTFGKASVQSIIPLSDGSGLRLTTAKYLTPKGHSINKVGVAPDIEVKMTKEQMAQLLTASMQVPGTVNGEPKKETDDQKKEEEKIVDIQLQRAIELLQGYDIFKSLEQNINIAKQQSPEASQEETPETESPETPPALIYPHLQENETEVPQPEEVPVE
ncbi:MAG: S41 family peptidase [Candidatus Abyssubacteria bacterium]